MEHANVATEVTIHHEPSASTKRIWKVFWILLIITMIELGLGLSLYALSLPEGLRMHLIKGVIIILSLAKAYYIVSVFMHLGDEIRNMIVTIVVPLMLFSLLFMMATHIRTFAISMTHIIRKEQYTKQKRKRKLLPIREVKIKNFYCDKFL